MINYLGIEDRWSNDPDYRSRAAVVRDIPDKDAALHRDIQAALFFQDNHMSPYDPNTSISELLMMARIWVRHRADEHAGRQESLTRACVIAENDGIARRVVMICYAKSSRRSTKIVSNKIGTRDSELNSKQYIMTWVPPTARALWTPPNPPI